MNTDQLIKMLESYLQLLQAQDANNDDEITQVKLMIWSIRDDLRTKRFINSLSLGNRAYRR